MPRRKLESVLRGGADPAIAAHILAKVDETAIECLRQSNGDLVRLVETIKRVGQGDASALHEVEHIAHQIHVNSVLLGSHQVGVLSEAIEHLAARILADLQAHAPIADSALVRQISDLIAGLERAVQEPPAARGTRAAIRRTTVV